MDRTTNKYEGFCHDSFTVHETAFSPVEDFVVATFYRSILGHIASHWIIVFFYNTTLKFNNFLLSYT